MRALAIMLLVLAGCTAPLRIAGTAPTVLVAGPCEAPVRYPAGKRLLWVHAQAGGRHDSVAVLPGQPFAFAWSLPPGPYRVRAWAALEGRAGCDTAVMVEVTQ